MESTAELSLPKICVLCNENISKYCCPRCEALYCSLECYKSQNHLQCSEEFYRECITKELAGNQVDDISKQKMIDILTKMHQQDMDHPDGQEDIFVDSNDSDEEHKSLDSDDEELIDLKDRMKDLDLDNAEEVWKVLTEDEKNEFEAFIRNGVVDSIVPQWEPWWLYNKKPKLVEDVSDDSDDKLEMAAIDKCPMIKKVSKLNELTNVKPSPAIKFNIINVLASYAFIARYFNGEIDPLEGTAYLLEVCNNLDSNANFDDPQVAIESAAQKCIQSELIETDESSLDVMKHDTLLILNGPSCTNKSYYCKSALSHVYYLFSESKNAMKSKKSTDCAQSKSSKEFTKKFPEHKREHLPKCDVNKVKMCIKKIEYYLSYIESYGIITE